MCGIVGLIYREPLVMSRAIKNALNSMRRRGPDDEGAVFFDASQKKIAYGSETPGNVIEFLANRNIENIDSIDFPSTVAFGHRRLSILDLSSHGHQPMDDPSGRYWIVFNGEVFNFKVIREELISLGYVFKSNTDSEVILNSYIQWGSDCLSRFNGMFAISIYDRKTKKVFLARDRVGIKPLYYSAQSDRFIFASDIKTILSTKLVEPEVDMEGLYHNFAFSMTPRPNTSFKNIKAVRPGCYYIIDTESLTYTETQYWDIPTGVQDLSMSESEAIELVESELKRSIELQLIADVDVGTFMSGGIDSTTVSAMASEMHPGIKAFTLAFDKSISKYDELDEAKATAAMHDMQHVIATLDADVVLNNINNMVLGYEEPFHHLAANFAISDVVSKNDIKVVLNGLGGDELFAGYGHYGNLDKWRSIRRLSNLVCLIPNGINARFDKLKALGRSKTVPEYYATCFSNYQDFESERLFGKSYNSISEVGRQYVKDGTPFTDDIEMLSYLDIKSYIGNHHLHRTDQFTMHFSLEGRFPFLDHELIEKAFTIPSKYKVKNGIKKYALRKVAEKYIHPSCLSMQKKGFGLPLEYWFEHDLKEMTNETIYKLKKRAVFESKAIDQVINKGTIKQKWQLVMTELWMTEFIDSSTFQR